MNKFELYFYNLIKKNPKIKSFIRNLYQRFFMILPHPIAVSDYHIIERNGYFYGFHDKSPFSFEDHFLLSHRYSISNRTVNPYDTVDVGFFKGTDYSEFVKIDSSRAWNWQQGSMLQWIGENNQILFNDFDGKYISKVYDVFGNCLDVINYPIASISFNSLYATTYDFNLLNKGMPGYGYLHEENTKKNEIATLHIIDFTNYKILRSIQMKELNNKEYDHNMTLGLNFFTHTLFSPDSNRLLFMQRSYQKHKRLHSRLVVYDISSDTLFILPTNGMVSHFTWLDSNSILAYCSVEGQKDGYFVFTINPNRFYRLFNDKYIVDGHPQYNQLNHLVVSDTYPNRKRMQKLILIDISKNIINVIAQLYSPFKYIEEVRCDLNPRWNHHGNIICFDSAHSGKRSLCTLNLNNNKGNIKNDIRSVNFYSKQK